MRSKIGNSICFLAACILFLTLAGCLEKDERVEISPGNNGKCSEKLIEYMADRYGIYIPEHADFAGGYFTNTFRDPAVIVAFDIELSQWEGWREGMSRSMLFFLLSHGVDLFSSESYGTDDVKRLGEEFGRSYGSGVSYSGFDSHGFSFLVCSDPDEPTVSFLFRATGCGNPFS